MGILANSGNTSNLTSGQYTYGGGALQLNQQISGGSVTNSPLNGILSPASASGAVSANGSILNMSALDASSQGVPAYLQQQYAAQNQANGSQQNQQSLQQAAQQAGVKPDVAPAPLHMNPGVPNVTQGIPKPQPFSNASILQPINNGQATTQELGATGQSGPTSTTPQSQPAPQVPQVQQEQNNNSPQQNLGPNAQGFLNGGLLQGINIGGSISNGLLEEGGADYGHS